MRTTKDLPLLQRLRFRFATRKPKAGDRVWAFGQEHRVRKVDTLTMRFVYETDRFVRVSSLRDVKFCRKTGFWYLPGVIGPGAPRGIGA